MSTPSLAELDVTMDGAEVLDAVARFLGRFVVFPEHGLTAVTLWAGHTHLVDTGENTPRLALLSPEPGSGKTRSLEVLDLLVPRSLFVLNASTAAIFRSMAATRPTLLFDEVDALFTKRGKDDTREDLRALLNAGHRRGARIPRCDGPLHQVVQFPVFGAVALAGLGDLPDTLMSRSVIIRMRRRAPGEHVEPFRARQHRPEGEALRDRLAGWCATVAEQITHAWPKMPDGVTDRPADVWEALLAVADAAGGDWPAKARSACSALVAAARSTESGSLGVRLLADLRTVFADTKTLLGEADALHTQSILDALHKIEDAPWADLKGKPLDARGLARRLRTYGVSPGDVKIDGTNRKGYRREDLWDPWTRYLPVTEPDRAAGLSDPRRSATGATCATSQVNDGRPVADEVAGSATARTSATDHEPVTSDVAQVAQVAQFSGPERGDNVCDRCQASPSRLGFDGGRWCASCAPALWEDHNRPSTEDHRKALP